MQYSKIMEEQRRLEEVKRELARMSEPMRKDVEHIRERCALFFLARAWMFALEHACVPTHAMRVRTCS